MLRHGRVEAAKTITCRENVVDFGSLAFDSYYASILTDFLRQRALELRRSFTFETVMSHRNKVDLLAQAQAAGFRTHLYFVATERPSINEARVQYRVSEGGHNVPPDKIESRYYRTLELLPEAIRFSNRAYFFDNSDKAWYFAEITDGVSIELKSKEFPNWFQPIWDTFAD
jgi:predicted ABC-type ATPase